MKRAWVVLLLSTLSAFSLQMVAYGEELPTFVEVEATIYDKAGLVYRADVDLGDLPKDKTGIVRVKLYNPFDETLEVLGFDRGCGCLKPSLQTFTLLAKCETIIDFRIETRATSLISHLLYAVNFELKGRAQLSLGFKYRLKDLLVIPNPVSFVEFEPQSTKRTFSVPLLITPAIVAEDVIIDASESLGHIDFKIEKRNSSFSLTGSLPPDAMRENAEYVGTVSLTSVSPPAAAAMNLIVRAASSVKVSPSVLYFTQQEPSTPYTARAMVRLTDASGPQSVIGCSIDDKPIECKSKHLGNGIYSVSVSMPANTKFAPQPDTERSSEPLPKLRFQIRNPTQSWQTENQISFMN